MTPARALDPFESASHHAQECGPDQQHPDPVRHAAFHDVGELAVHTQLQLAELSCDLQLEVRELRADVLLEGHLGFEVLVYLLAELVYFLTELDDFLVQSIDLGLQSPCALLKIGGS